MPGYKNLFCARQRGHCPGVQRQDAPSAFCWRAPSTLTILLKSFLLGSGMTALRAAKRLGHLSSRLCTFHPALTVHSPGQDTFDNGAHPSDGQDGCKNKFAHSLGLIPSRRAFYDRRSEPSPAVPAAPTQQISYTALPALSPSYHLHLDHGRLKRKQRRHCFAELRLGLPTAPRAPPPWGALCGSSGSACSAASYGSCRGLPGKYTASRPLHPGSAKQAGAAAPAPGRQGGPASSDDNNGSGGSGSSTGQAGEAVPGAGWTRWEVVNAPNLISLARLASGPLIAHWIVAGELRLALGGLVVAGASPPPLPHTLAPLQQPPFSVCS